MQRAKTQIIQLVEARCNSKDNPECLVYVCRSQQGTELNPRAEELTADLAWEDVVSGSFSSADLIRVLPPRGAGFSGRMMNESVRSFCQPLRYGSSSVRGCGGIALNMSNMRNLRVWRVAAMERPDQVILPTAPAVSNEGGSSELLALLPAVSWPRVSAWGSLEPPRRDGENAQKTGENGGKMGEIRPKTCEGRELTKDQLDDTFGRQPLRLEVLTDTI